MRRVVLAQAHNASYADPILVRAGEPLALSGREDLWEGHRWLWAVAADGREGWVPDSLPCSSATGHVAAWDYAAIELTCTAGEQVILLRESHGWAWCRKADGDEGWLPLRILVEDRAD